jgi:hypothetical protein
MKFFDFQNFRKFQIHHFIKFIDCAILIINLHSYDNHITTKRHKSLRSMSEIFFFIKKNFIITISNFSFVRFSFSFFFLLILVVDLCQYDVVSTFRTTKTYFVIFIDAWIKSDCVVVCFRSNWMLRSSWDDCELVVFDR